MSAQVCGGITGLLTCVTSRACEGSGSFHRGDASLGALQTRAEADPSHGDEILTLSMNTVACMLEQMFTALKHALQEHPARTAWLTTQHWATLLLAIENGMRSYISSWHGRRCSTHLGQQGWVGGSPERWQYPGAGQ